MEFLLLIGRVIFFAREYAWPFPAALNGQQVTLADQARRANRCQKSGNDLATHVSPVIRTPGTFRPATAKLIAIR
jgi:hypothetical protein